MSRVKICRLFALALFAGAASLGGCASGTSALSTPPTFGNSNLDHSSHLERLQARGEQYPSVEPAGYSAANPTFSRGYGSRSGSC